MAPQGVSGALARTIYPYQALHRLAVRRFLDRGGATAWTQILVQLHYATSMTSPLLLNAADRARHLGGTHHERFALWCVEHAEEEEPHGDWMLDDLVGAGLDRKAIKHGVPNQNVLKLIGSQFMIAQSNHPMGILGYFFAGECHPGTVAGIEWMADKYGMNRSALKTVIFHADEDVAHAREIVDLMGTTSPEDYEHIATSALLYINGWTAYYREALGTLDLSPAIASV